MVEVAQGNLRFAGLDGLGPFDFHPHVAAVVAGEYRVNLLVFRRLSATGHGKELPTGTIIVSRIQNSLGAYNQRAAVGRAVAMEKLRGRQFLFAVLFAFVPEKIHRAAALDGWEFQFHHRPSREGFWIDGTYVNGLHPVWLGEFAAHVGEVGGVAGHVAHRAGTVIPPAAPLEGMITGIVRPHFGRSDEGIPIHMIRHGLLRQTLGHSRSLRPHGAVGPHVAFLDLANGAGPQRLHALAHASARGALVAHLRANLVLLRHQPHLACFPHGMSQRLLAIHVDALVHRADGGRRVGVIRGGNGAGIDVLAHLVEHLTEVGELLSLGPFLCRAAAAIEITITQCNHLANLASATYVATAFAAHSDAGHGDAFIGAKNTRGKEVHSDGRGRAGLQDIASSISFDESLA